MNAQAQTTAAQRRSDRIRLFREELAELEREGVLALTPEQRSRLEAHLQGRTTELAGVADLETTEAERRISWAVRVASLLGAAAFFAALILFLHRIWGVLPFVAQATLLVALPLCFLAAAEISHRRRASLYYTDLLAIAAGVGFVLTLNALGAILNLAPSPHALLAWGGFAVLMAYAYGLRVPLAAGLLLLTAWSACLLVSAGGLFWGAPLDWPESLLPAAVVLYALPLLGRPGGENDFDFVYRLCGAGSACFALLLLATQGQSSALPVSAGVAETAYQVLGLLVGAGVVIHGIRLGRTGLVNFGAVAFVVFLYANLHAWCWDWMPKYLFFFLIGLVAVGLLCLFRKLRACATERRAS